MDFDFILYRVMEIEGLYERWRRSPYENLDDAQMNKERDFLKKINIW